MRIRNASITDLEAIIALSNSIQQQHAAALPDFFKTPAKSSQTMNAFRDFLNAPDTLLLLAEESQPIGYLWAQFLERPQNWARFGQRLLYIQHLAVSPQHQRKGTGTALLAKAQEIAREKGIQRIELDVWSFNSEARDFYAKNGFVTFNERMAISI